MGIDVEVPPTHGDHARECIRAARANMREVKQLLSQHSDHAGQNAEQNAEACAALLRQVEVQLGCAVAIFKTRGSQPSAEIQSILEAMQGEIAVLAQFLAEADKLLAGWLRALSSRQSGYTMEGRSAPLILLKKVSVEG
jgi:hypothetical protein